jgi:hypothetical protein
MKHISLTAPVRVPNGYSRTVLQDDGRTPVVSSLPKRDRNGATIAAWTLANDMRAGRV